jgi:hypothetical protein
MDNTFASDFFNQTLSNLGLDSGSAAAKTVGNVIGSAKNAPTPATPASGPFVIPQTIFGMDRKTAGLVGVALVLVVYLAVRRK